MFRCRLHAVLLAATLMAPQVARAEVKPLSEEEKLARASNVVAGHIQAIYGFDHEETEGFKKGLVTRHYVLEIKISKVEKGTDLKERTAVYARGWAITKYPRPIEGASGHRIWEGKTTVSRPMHLPIGQNVRVFLTRSADGGLDMVLPNGLEVLATEKTK